MAESTPAPKLSFDSAKSESAASTSFLGTGTYTPPVQPVAQSTFIKPNQATIVQVKAPPKPVLTSKVDLKSLLGDFDRDLEQYKRDNAKVNLIGLDEQAKK